MARLSSLLVAVAVGFVAAGLTLQTAQGAATCKEDSDCSALENAICYESRCTCPDESLPNDDYTRCLPPSVDSSSACEAAIQCGGRLGVGVQCRDRQCLCGPGSHYLHGACHKSAGLGEPCSVSDDCFDNYATHTLTCSNGTNGTCACADGAYSRYGVCRLKAKGAGDACDIDDDCKAANASLSCVENICTSSDAADTKPSAIANTFAKSGEYHGATRSMVISNTTCAIDADCGTGETCSVLKTCACKMGYFRDTDGACKLELGEACEADADCSHIAGARCGTTDSSRGPTCHCGPRWAPDPTNSFCRLARKMNYSCAVDANCFSFGNGKCNDYKCSCNDGFRFVEERNFCWPIKELGDECTETLDCNYENSTCTEGVCGCVEGYHGTSKGTCLKDIKELGDECVVNSECTAVAANSNCKNGKCSCKTYYVQTGPTACSIGVGGRCSDNETCSAVSGAFCDGRKCACEEGYTLSAASDTCLEVTAEAGGNCTETAQCLQAMGEYSMCNTTTGSCTCFAGMHFADGNCWNKTVLGERCGRSSECFVVGSREGLECRNGFCECKFDYLASDDGSACVSGSTSALRLGASTSALLLMAVSLLRNSL